MAGRLGAARFWGEFEDDDITRLPRDYEAKVTDDDRVYFVKYVMHFLFGKIHKGYFYVVVIQRRKHIGRTH